MAGFSTFQPASERMVADSRDAASDPQISSTGHAFIRVPQLQNQNGGDKNVAYSNASNATSSAGQQLVDFLPILEDYNTTIPDAATSAFLSSAGFTSNDPRIVRLISIAGQKFISDITLDALQHCKVRTSNQSSKSKTKERTFTFTMDDLAPALSERGVTVRKPPYFV